MTDTTSVATEAVEVSRAEVCVAACARIWKDDGEALASPFGVIPRLAARLAQIDINPDLLLTDGVSHLIRVDPVDNSQVVEGWLPFRNIFNVVWGGKRHCIMGAAQLDAFGNSNISCIGRWERPTVQLIGMRGAPGNTVNHPCSYWIADQSKRVFVERVDVISGVGNDPELWGSGLNREYHDLRQVITNLAVFDFKGPEGRLRLLTTHPGVEVDDVLDKMAFVPAIAEEVTTTEPPSARQLALIRDTLDPKSNRNLEVPDA